MNYCSIRFYEVRQSTSDGMHGWELDLIRNPPAATNRLCFGLGIDRLSNFRALGRMAAALEPGRSDPKTFEEFRDWIETLDFALAVEARAGKLCATSALSEPTLKFPLCPNPPAKVDPILVSGDDARASRAKFESNPWFERFCCRW